MTSRGHDLRGRARWSTGAARSTLRESERRRARPEGGRNGDRPALPVRPPTSAAGNERSISVSWHDAHGLGPYQGLRRRTGAEPSSYAGSACAAFGWRCGTTGRRARNDKEIMSCAMPFIFTLFICHSPPDGVVTNNSKLSQSRLSERLTQLGTE